MEAVESRELQARNYLEKHRIMELLNHLTSVLLFIRPPLKNLDLCTADEVLNDDGHIITLDKFRDEVNMRTWKIWKAF
ncbi:EF-hand calcium-binding domain-containing protein 10-like isoform X4 [Heterocephalus glaber]|uniref:EF-hand calcium-binding domain-containing protein 10-like isoform X4 n=1 Tax=Heterocephalus glaber TaxID=10181 RepID=A0AAX6SM29_HETGA|nr:EF-hand calcium-binding domain-containing protein 10-like isoform X4 [Heterocephalus glaber]